MAKWRIWVAIPVVIVFFWPFLALAKVCDWLHELLGSYGKLELYVTHPLLKRLIRWSRK